MAKKLTDLNQLTKAILKESPPPCRVEKHAPELSQSREDADAAAVLAYFSHPSQNAPQRNRAASCAVPAKDRPVDPASAPVEVAPVVQSVPLKSTQLSPERSESRSGAYQGCDGCCCC